MNDMTKEELIAFYKAHFSILYKGRFFTMGMAAQCFIFALAFMKIAQVAAMFALFGLFNCALCLASYQISGFIVNKLLELEGLPNLNNLTEKEKEQFRKGDQETMDEKNKTRSNK